MPPVEWLKEAERHFGNASQPLENQVSSLRRCVKDIFYACRLMESDIRSGRVKKGVDEIPRDVIARKKAQEEESALKELGGEEVRVPGRHEVLFFQVKQVGRIIDKLAKLIEIEHEPSPERLEYNKDNWKRRSQAMRCRTCMFFVPKMSSRKREEDEPVAYRTGRCRKCAPTLNGWPVVYPSDWCGSHKLDEKKI